MKYSLLNDSYIRQLLSLEDIINGIRSGFAAYSLNKEVTWRKSVSPLPGGKASAAVLFPGLVDGIPAYMVKVHAKFPGQNPAISGVIHLHDLETGELLAVMDSSYITAVRTGIAGALGTDVLSRADARRVGIIGCGVQGELQLRSLTLFREIEEVYAFDSIQGKADEFAGKMETETDLKVAAVSELAEVVQNSDIIIAATWATEPFLFSDQVRPGTHITTLGADQPGKCEVSAELIESAKFICDDRDLAVRMGAIAGAGLSANAIDAELGEVIAEKKAGRTAPDEITVFGSVGLAFQDLVAAWHVYQRAKEEGVGEEYLFRG